MVIEVAVACPFCGEINVVRVLDEDYLAWHDGALVQEAFPYLSADDRELLISGICPTCWEKTFGSEEQEGDKKKMKIYEVTFGAMENKKFFTSRKKVLTFIKEKYGHNPIRANVPNPKDYFDNYHWLEEEELKNAINGKWESKEINFFGREGFSGYYFDKYTIKEINVE